MKPLTEQGRQQVLRTLSDSVASVMEVLISAEPEEAEMIGGVTHEVVLRPRDGGPALVLRVSVDERAAEGGEE